MSRKYHFEVNGSDFFIVTIKILDCLFFCDGFHRFNAAFGLLFDPLDNHANSVNFTLFGDEFKLFVDFQFIFNLLDWSFDVDKFRFIFEEADVDGLHWFFKKDF